MVNPLLLFSVRKWTRNPHHTARRRHVPIPHDDDTDGPIFLVLRRLRAPIVLILVAFATAVLGLHLVPAPPGEERLTLFDAFYVISYTATTIGFGEIPYSFSVAQRMWTVLAIYLTVVTWAYALGVVFSLFQDVTFRDAVAAHRVRTKVRRLAEPFVIVCGFGQAGRRVGAGLDDAGYRFVAVDRDERRVEDLVATARLVQDVPGLAGDASLPAVLGRAGLDHPRCTAVLALTDNDTTNLAIVMAGNLLRPEIPVIARCHAREVEERMHEFGVDEVVNPFDRYGAYLLLAMQRPAVHQLVTWLLAPLDAELPEREDDLRSHGRWLVIGDDLFAEELVADLRHGGLDVNLVDSAGGLPEVAGIVGFVAGTHDDTINIALAEQARLASKELFVCVRQSGAHFEALTDALDLDSVFVPTKLVAQETLARVVTPLFRAFVDEVIGQDDAWAADVVERLVDRCGDRNQPRDVLTLDRSDAPAVVKWLGSGRSLTLGHLMRHPDDREQAIAALPLMLVREDGERLVMPPDDTELAEGDRLLLAGGGQAMTDLTEVLYYDSALTYVATGETLPTTWLFRKLSRARR